MHFDSKFNVGDIIYSIDNRPSYSMQDCFICENTGVVELKGLSFRCPHCKGDGEVEIRRENYFISKEKISAIECRCHDDDIDIRYMVGKYLVTEDRIDSDEGLCFTKNRLAKKRLDVLLQEEQNEI